MKNFEYITYATPNKAAFEILDPEYQENKSVFPDTDELENSEVYSYLGTEADDLYNALWKEVKSTVIYEERESGETNSAWFPFLIL